MSRTDKPAPERIPHPTSMPEAWSENEESQAGKRGGNAAQTSPSAAMCQRRIAKVRIGLLLLLPLAAPDQIKNPASKHTLPQM